MSSSLHVLKKYIKNKLLERWGTENPSQYLLARYAGGVRAATEWNYCSFKTSVLRYLDERKVGTRVWKYGFSNSRNIPSIYTATYALMIRSLLMGPDCGLTAAERADYAEYFLTLQQPDTGYFVDPILEDGDYIKEIDENNIWWGYGHILLQVIICLQILGVTPRYPFHFLEKFYSKNDFIAYLESLNIDERVAYTGNVLMNIGVPLQYQEITCGNVAAASSFQVLLQWLRKTCDSETGLLGKGDFQDPHFRSQAVQCAYHYWPLFFYAGEQPVFTEKTLEILLQTQNFLGGYGVNAFTSSACEDIDSIEPLARTSLFASPASRKKVEKSLRIAFPWILANQNQDGGFVFQLDTPMTYGHPSLSSASGESNLFATWFRTLSIGYLTKRLDFKEYFYFISAPGYCFPLNINNKIGL